LEVVSNKGCVGILDKVIFVKFRFGDTEKSIPLLLETIYDLMEDESFIRYCKAVRNFSEKRVKHFCYDRKGRILSPRWILEYLQDEKEDLRISHDNELPFIQTKVRKFSIN
jgi:hypothetical protein